MEEEGDKEVNEEGNVTLAGSAESRWVDGSEFDSGSPTWSLLDNEEMRQGFGSVRRRLVKKAKRVDSFDVEAMEIAGANGDDSKVLLIADFSLSSRIFVCLFLLNTH